MSDACAVALKEWAVAIRAIGEGRQLVLFRKGGLIESSPGFTLESDRFLLYPTYEHQTRQYVRPEFVPVYDAAAAAKRDDGQLRLEWFAQVMLQIHTHDASVLDRLAMQHIYNDALLTQRLKWAPDQPLAILVVRAWRLAMPAVLPMREAYAGCRSWVHLDRDVDLGPRVPAVADEAFAARLRAIRETLDDLGSPPSLR